MDKPLDVARLEAELTKLIFEALKLRQESQWMSFVWATGMVVSIVTITKYFLV